MHIKLYNNTILDSFAPQFALPPISAYLILFKILAQCLQNSGALWTVVKAAVPKNLVQCFLHKTSIVTVMSGQRVSESIYIYLKNVSF